MGVGGGGGGEDKLDFRFLGHTACIVNLSHLSQLTSILISAVQYLSGSIILSCSSECILILVFLCHIARIFQAVAGDCQLTFVTRTTTRTKFNFKFFLRILRK